MVNKMDVEVSKIRNKSHYSVVALFLVSLAVTAALLLITGENWSILREGAGPPPPSLAGEIKYEEGGDINETASSCDLFSGEWIYDEMGNASYSDGRCSFMMGDYACEKFGRKDLRYRNWRWQPHRCNLPRSELSLLIKHLASA